MSKFAQDFLVGAATAAHQVEGNNTNSDYWTMEHMTYTSFTEPSMDAVDHYNRYEEDIKMMAEAGLNAYRFSIEWARIEPKKGEFDENEIEHYRKVLECCKANGIEPVVTLLHFTSPKWLIEEGGWENEATVELFARYAKYVVEKLGSYMHYICTINEANMGLQIAAISARYKAQMMARMQQGATENASEDAAKSTEGTVQVGLNMQKMMENMQKQAQENMEVFGVATPQIFVSGRTPEGDILVMKAHQAAKKAIKEVDDSLQVGITLSLHDIQAKEGGEEQAAKEWDEEFLHYVSYIKEDDFFGLQNYTRSVYDANGICPIPEGAELTQMDYEIYPQALEACIRKAYKELQMPIMVTENGIAVDDDTKRVDFIEKATDGVANCIADGIPVKGYMYWSLMDNFEWQKGFSMTFGLIAVDRSEQKRIAKPSLNYLGSLAK
ncbi:MAG: family 1 glycosylhydrolase [Lachnospiraceae bacterium]|nr:family 1 glycosylhydrolase [Lachnospiraceae bacterium]